MEDEILYKLHKAMVNEILITLEKLLKIEVLNSNLDIDKVKMDYQFVKFAFKNILRIDEVVVKGNKGIILLEDCRESPDNNKEYNSNDHIKLLYRDKASRLIFLSYELLDKLNRLIVMIDQLWYSCKTSVIDVWDAIKSQINDIKNIEGEDDNAKLVRDRNKIQKPEEEEIRKDS